ncbi:MAG: hypothetical protein EB015_15155 [Methylocystaceae bacterium]|nr:hypothetical protein [Methylocystaceae bacterium]
MPRKLSGVLPIVQTPFSADDVIDTVALKRSVDWAFQVGAQGLGTGMVSETVRLTAGERVQLISALIEASDGRGPVFIAGGKTPSDMRKRIWRGGTPIASANSVRVIAIS